MAIRLQEMHPALVHLPIVLLPLAVGADLLGSATENKSLLWLGQTAISLAAAGAVASAIAGLIAGEEVNVEGDSRDMLMTHRNLNVAATIVASSMALWRIRRQTPNAVYLGVGAAGIGILGYTAYLGGKLVYDSGVGVEPAHGVYRADAPRLRASQLSAFVKAAGTDLIHGVRHMAQEMGNGQIIPTIVAGFGKRRGAPPPVKA